MRSRHPRTITHRRLVDATRLDEVLAELRVPRHDLLVERPATAGDSDIFELDSGPFHEYRRGISVERDGDRFAVVETFTYELAAPVWQLLFRFPVARTLRHRPGHGRNPWWAPPVRLDARSSSVLALLCTVALVCGYLGTVITQTITFAADEFGNDKGDQGVALAAVRIGVFLSMSILALADRQGRRALTSWGTVAACCFTVLGAFSVDLWTLGASQTAARGITTAVALLVTIVAAEELPAGARAYGLSVLTLTAGLGAGMAVWVLPVADLDVRAWRIVYLLPVFAVPLLLHVVRQLPETRRFEVSHTARPAPLPRGRLIVLAVSALLLTLFRSPASQLQNEFLRDERGYSAAMITLFTIVTSTPIGIGVFVGGRLADSLGRRIVAAVALVAGSVLVVISFLTHGWQMWIWQLAGLVIGAATVPALGVYGPELFGTRARGRANGLVSIAGVLGSTIGLLAASQLSDHLGLGASLAVFAVGPAIVAVLVLVAYPETAHLELEQINPGDAAVDHPGRSRSPAASH
jgi:MFS family permease